MPLRALLFIAYFPGKPCPGPGSPGGIVPPLCSASHIASRPGRIGAPAPGKEIEIKAGTQKLRQVTACCQQVFQAASHIGDRIPVNVIGGRNVQLLIFYICPTGKLPLQSGTLAEDQGKSGNGRLFSDGLLDWACPATGAGPVALCHSVGEIGFRPDSAFCYRNNSNNVAILLPRRALMAKKPWYDWAFSGMQSFPLDKA